MEEQSKIGLALVIHVVTVIKIHCVVLYGIDPHQSRQIFKFRKKLQGKVEFYPILLSGF